MKLPVRNNSTKPLTLFLEPYCDEYVLAPGLEAIVWLGDETPVEIEFYDDRVVIWHRDEWQPSAEVLSEGEQSIVTSLKLAQAWLEKRDKASFDAIGDEISRLEKTDGYVKARACVFAAFHSGFCAKILEVSPHGAVTPVWSGPASLAACYRAGGVAAYQNHLCRGDDAFPGPGIGPFDTEFARLAFQRAAAVVGAAGPGSDVATLQG